MRKEPGLGKMEDIDDDLQEKFQFLPNLCQILRTQRAGIESDDSAAVASMPVPAFHECDHLRPFWRVHSMCQMPLLAGNMNTE